MRMHIETELSVLDRELSKVETLDIVFVYTTFKVGRLCETHEMIQMEGRLEVRCFLTTFHVVVVVKTHL